MLVNNWNRWCEDEWKKMKSDWQKQWWHKVCAFCLHYQTHNANTHLWVFTLLSLIEDLADEIIEQSGHCTQTHDPD